MRVLQRRVNFAALLIGAFICHCLMVPSESAAQPLPNYLKFNFRYEKARKLLLRSGWRAEGFSKRTPHSCEPARDERCKTYNEAQSCNSQGVMQCNMFWLHNDGTKLIVVVVADEKKIQRVKAISQP